MSIFTYSFYFVNIRSVLFPVNGLLLCVSPAKGGGLQPPKRQHDTRRPSTIGPITRGMIKKLQDEYSPKGQTLFSIFGWKIGDLEDAFKMPKHGEGWFIPQKVYHNWKHQRRFNEEEQRQEDGTLDGKTVTTLQQQVYWLLSRHLLQHTLEVQSCVLE
ncbi:hypothetical protein LR48_Vigan10g208700 [Vigna angularis]|uniref:Uncharacterized protein n=1 Tax=Phaseolus angularis TaxID=3914 RepID=A0A0L9VMB4_PHAAN|nr:hypothetical protein LR48_Vigan10g208700 [Vigna angularis]